MGDCFYADVPTSWDEVEVWGPCTEEAILARIWWEVRARIMNKGQFKGSDKQLALVAKWNLFSLV